MAIDNQLPVQESVAAHGETEAAAPVFALTAAPARLDEAAIDPRNSAVLRQELPGLAAAFDARAMQHALQAALFDPQHADVVIDRCAIEQVTYIPGQGVVLRYLLALRDRGSGQSHAALISGRLFPDQPACESYIRTLLDPLVAPIAVHPDLALFAHPTATIAPLHMVLHAFPIDGELPTLLGVTNRDRMRAVFQATLPAAQARILEAQSCRVELVDYGRQYRCTLRYHVAGPTYQGDPFQQVVYGKLTGDGTGAMAGAISSALHDRIAQFPAGMRFAVPQVYAWLPDLKLSLLEALRGEALIADMVKGRLRGLAAPAGVLSLEAAIETCGRIAATLHTSNLRLGRPRTLEGELRALRQECAHIQRISPELGEPIGCWLDWLEAAATRTQPLPPCFNHGDFTHGQILFDGAASGLIDFDSVCQAEPALDLGQFLTYMRLAGLKSRLTSDETRAVLAELGDRFISAYRDSGGAAAADPPQLAARVAVYRGVSLLRRIIRSWRKFKPGRAISALAILEDELAELHPLA